MRKDNILFFAKIFSVCFLLLIAQDAAYSQVGNVTDFLPLKTGNIWVYHCSAFNITPPCLCSRYYKIKLISTTVINGKTYYQVQTSIITLTCYGSCGSGLLPLDSLLRVDSMSGKVLRYAPGAGCFNTPDEILLDSLKARLNDTIRYRCQPPVQWNTYKCTDTNNVNIFGSSRQSRTFGVTGFEGGWGRRYVKGIGLTNANGYSLVCVDNTTLLGCVLDGVVYGDTSFIVGIKQISSEVPDKFSLSQNYPNPFNPSTTIEFDIPASCVASLTIYDVTGRRVESLVNELVPPGRYRVLWNAENYSSGVYFYKLSADDFSVTKRMVLIK
ncbi:MAG: T9SS C-terminal target domain-containing protein [Ignavibacteriae bacterium]|nr:MAG: T9SS C-terminal target domain-containing protein [Ignavibacteriota bacterium]